jgi:hypothetical protein
MKEENILYAEYNGMILAHHNGVAANLSAGIHVDMTRKEFRQMCKEKHLETWKPLKLGEYVNIHTHKVERLWGIE